MIIDEKTLLPAENVKPIANMQMEFDVDFFVNMDNPLKNQMHESFAQNIVQGKSATEAYYLAHQSSGKKEISRKSCTEKGCRLLQDSNIVNRINFLRKAVISQITMSNLEVHKHLVDIIRDVNERTADRINAIKLLAQIKGMLNVENEINTSQQFVNLKIEVVDAKKEDNGRE